MATILVVEDDLALREGLVHNLRRNAYEVEEASDGVNAVKIAQLIKPDLILLDVMLPGLDGFEVCRILRKELPCPILMLTARSDEVDRIIGLEIGADDYIVKPFSMRELLARIKAHLRRNDLILSQQKKGTDAAPDSKELHFDNLVIDPERMSVKLNGNALKLNSRQYELLFYLAQNQGRVISRKAILEKIWGWDYFTDTHTVDVYIHKLRQLIEDDPQNPHRILTVHGSGYRFEG